MSVVSNPGGRSLPLAGINREVLVVSLVVRNQVAGRCRFRVRLDSRADRAPVSARRRC